MTYKPHITQVKKDEVADMKRLFKEYPVAGIINLEGLPTLMLQRILFALGDDIVLKVTKKRLMKLAIHDLAKDHKNIDQLEQHLSGIPALMFTKVDPFLMYKKIEKNKASAAAKVGQKAPNDLGVEAGPTPFAPGPMIGELGMLGLKTEVKDGKIHIKDDKVLVKDGEEISEQVAGLLSKLGIEPMKVGLNVMVTYQDGEILDKSILGVDEAEYIENIKIAAVESLGLAMQCGIVTKETITPMLTKAQRESLALAEGTDVMTPENAGNVVAKAEAAASKIDDKVPDAPVEEKPVEKVEEAPQEEGKETPKEPVEEPKADPIPEPERPPVEEPPPETPAEPAEKPVTEEPKDIKQDAATKEAAQEPSSEADSMKKTAALAQEIMGSGITENGSKESTQPQEQDITKLINKLKDEKSAGEAS